MHYKVSSACLVGQPIYDSSSCAHAGWFNHSQHDTLPFNLYSRDSIVLNIILCVCDVNAADGYRIQNTVAATNIKNQVPLCMKNTSLPYIIHI